MSASAAAAHDGPLIFYWHGTGASPSEAVVGLSQATIDAVTAAGGVVAAPYSDPDSYILPWFLTGAFGATGRDDDLRVADEVLACAMSQLGIDLRHIHSLGMSAGGLQTAQMGYRRSDYLASVVTYSGGISAASKPTMQDPSNHLSALIFHGGAGDIVVIAFDLASEAYWEDLSALGSFAVICNHEGGHRIPTEARASVWAFLQAHPYKQAPSPYVNGLPEGFPSYCALRP